ncbi:hypothetical protein SAMN05216382_2509 [Sphingomonas palmae]|uniref:Uncharacterized protein n=1 Tax=Sphingomonas palmae TaxID=1855283 RepID=A0A1H7SBY6_9SPHN|nr:hypothetical protein [Sphingomonas palmae]SEL69799.1 hypothetical protein SAMN05216382_2509 [Sphingomonas palmae]
MLMKAEAGFHMAIQWTKQFVRILAWPVLAGLATIGVLTLIRDAEYRPDWYVVLALLLGAASHASWRVWQRRFLTPTL